MAPEVTPLRAPLCGYGLEVDLWSAGICAFVMIAGQFPFAAPDEAALAALLAAAPAVRMDARVWAAVSPQGRDLVARLLEPQPDERPTADAALRHAWFAPPPPPPPRPPPPAASAQMAIDEGSEASLYGGPPSPTTPPATPPPAATGVRRRISRVLHGARMSHSPPSDACGAAVQEEGRLSRLSSGGVVTLLRALRTRLSSCRLAEDAADAEAVTAAPAEAPTEDDNASSAGDSPSCWRFGHTAIAPYSCITATDERDAHGRHGS
jgi:serine/threonine protein kinase